MLTKETIERLANLDGRGARILNVYLDIEPQRQIRHAYRAVFKDLVKAAREPLEEDMREALQGEVERVHAWFDEEPLQGKGLALFSCAPRNLWETYVLQVPVEDHLAYEPEPDVAPLLELLDEYERYAVALVDKERARLFTVFLGEIEESDAFKDFVPGKHDQGGLAQPRLQRHHEWHVHEHLKHVIAGLTELYRNRSFDRLIIAGPEEVASEARQMLPRALAQRLVAVIPAETTANTKEILEKTLQIEQQVERRVEESLLDELLERAGAGGPASCGVTPSLESIWLGKVHTLLIADDLHMDGSECPNCGRLETGIVATCPVCGSRMEQVHDLAHRAMDRTLEMNGGVEVIHGAAAPRLMQRCGGVGAFLRF
ncbi:MAG: peptide chain release factor subunit 1 [Chloroflexota bacterium]|jgi:peptide chain release factor subunit 1|nr:peptide chain release factor subunit 1 [Chloroflexota bacterium]